MQDNRDNPAKSITRTRLARTRFIGMQPTQQATGPLPTTDNLGLDQPTTTTKPQVLAVRNAVRTRLSSVLPQGAGEDQGTAHLLQLSGMIRLVHAPTQPLAEADEDGFWPLGIQQVGSLPIKNLYGLEPFGRTLPHAVPLVMSDQPQRVQPPWQKAWRSPAFKIAFGLLIGLGLLLLVSRFGDLMQALTILGTHLSTPQGIGLILLAAISYLAGRAIRGLRWKLFLNPHGSVSALKVVELSQVAALLNFLLPIRAGEAAKGLVLKRIAHFPLSKSLPTVAMDRSLDLLPGLVIVPLTPLLATSMNLQLWLLFSLGSAALLALLIFIGLVLWRRASAPDLLQTLPLPGAFSGKIESAVGGFVVALLAGARRPSVALPAVLLTCAGVICDSLLVMLAFAAIGLPIAFGTALLGCTIYGIFSLLPTPPGQIGSAEVASLLVFSGLLNQPIDNVLAMTILAHLWLALIIAASGTLCLRALGLTISNALHTR